MANAVYPSYRSAMMQAPPNLATGALKCALVSTTSGATNYVYSASHANFSDVPAGSIVSAGVALTNKVVSGGALNADPVRFASVAAPGGGQIGQALIYYVDSGTPATSPLVGYMDTTTGLPVTPNGQDITVNFSGSVLVFS